MRKITLKQIIVFIALFSSIICCSFGSALIITEYLVPPTYQTILAIPLSLFFGQLLALLSYRIFLKWRPLPVGEIPMSSRHEFSYHIHLLLHFFFFHPIIRTNILPVPIMKLYYLALGAKMGHNTYSSGVMFDSLFIEMGEHTLVGHEAALIPHAIENEFLAHYPIKIGSHVTIGTGARVLGGVIIDDYALVSANAVVTKGTHIRKGEIWGGVPAKLISKRPELGLDFKNKNAKVL